MYCNVEFGFLKSGHYFARSYLNRVLAGTLGAELTEGSSVNASRHQVQDFDQAVIGHALTSVFLSFAHLKKRLRRVNYQKENLRKIPALAVMAESFSRILYVVRRAPWSSSWTCEQ
jgi:hypothetical protein